MEDVDDDEGSLPPNVAPSNPSTLLERSDGSDDDEDLAPASESAIEIDDDSEDEEQAEESAEAELGQLF
jgi:hypothetical protein